MGLKSNDEPEAFDATRKFVRVCKQRTDGFVEFEFAIGDPALCVELMLPAPAFADFCRENDVVMLAPSTDDAGDWVARLNEASRREIDGSN